MAGELWVFKMVESWKKPWASVPMSDSVQDLSDGTGSFHLTDGDLNVLERLYERNVMAMRHMVADRLFSSTRYASKRLEELFAAGLVARRGMVSVDAAGKKRGWGYAYSLTEGGMACLKARGLTRVGGGRLPAWQTGSTRANATHELAVCDMAQALIQATKSVSSLSYWEPAKLVVQRTGHSGLHPAIHRNFVSPDAAVSIQVKKTTKTVLLEYERSLRPDKFRHKIEGYLTYYERDDWKHDFKLEEPPKVFVSVSRAGDRKQFASQFEGAVRLIQGMRSTLWPLANKLYLVEEEGWREGKWVLTALNEAEVDLHTALATPTTT